MHSGRDGCAQPCLVEACNAISPGGSLNALLFQRDAQRKNVLIDIVQVASGLGLRVHRVCNEAGR